MSGSQPFLKATQIYRKNQMCKIFRPMYILMHSVLEYWNVWLTKPAEVCGPRSEELFFWTSPHIPQIVLRIILVDYGSPVFLFQVHGSLTIYRVLLQSSLQLCGLQKLKFSLRGVFVYKNVTRVDYYDGELRLFYYCLLVSASVTLSRCLQKK